MSSFSIDLSEITGGRKEEKEPAIRPIMAAQYMELRERYARLVEQHHPKIRPGQFVREKPGLGQHKPEIPIALLLVRYLDRDDAYDLGLIADHIEHAPISMAAMPVDCVLAMVSDDSNTLIYMLRSTMLLEPMTDAEVNAIIEGGGAT